MPSPSQIYNTQNYQHLSPIDLQYITSPSQTYTIDFRYIRLAIQNFTILDLQIELHHLRLTIQNFTILNLQYRTYTQNMELRHLRLTGKQTPTILDLQIVLSPSQTHNIELHHLIERHHLRLTTQIFTILDSQYRTSSSYRTSPSQTYCTLQTFTIKYRISPSQTYKQNFTITCL